MPLWSNFLPLDFLGVSHRIQWKNINAIYCLQIPAFVPEIFKFEKCVKYANEMNDDVINSTQYYIMSINRAILGNLQSRSLKLGRLTKFYRKHTWGYKRFCCHGNSFPVSTHFICKYENWMPRVARNALHIGDVWNPVIKLLGSNCGAHLVESYREESNNSDTKKVL